MEASAATIDGDACACRNVSQIHRHTAVKPRQDEDNTPDSRVGSGQDQRSSRVSRRLVPRARRGIEST